MVTEIVTGDEIGTPAVVQTNTFTLYVPGERPVSIGNAETTWLDAIVTVDVEMYTVCPAEFETDAKTMPVIVLGVLSMSVALIASNCPMCVRYGVTTNTVELMSATGGIWTIAEVTSPFPSVAVTLIVFADASNVVIVNALVACPAPIVTGDAPLRLYVNEVIVVGATPAETFAHPVIVCGTPLVTEVGTVTKVTVGAALTTDSARLPLATRPLYVPVALIVNEPLCGEVNWIW